MRLDIIDSEGRSVFIEVRSCKQIEELEKEIQNLKEIVRRNNPNVNWKFVDELISNKKVDPFERLDEDDKGKHI
jgi:hypothetical protein